MQSLKQYIQEHLNRRFFASYEGVNNDIQDMIHEALMNSYDTDKLISKIAAHYNIDKDEFGKTPSKSKIRAFYVSKAAIKKHLNDEWLNDLLLMSGYYISDNKTMTVSFEPIFSDNITDKIQDDCGGKIYKIVTPELADSIRKKGGLYTDRDSDLKQLQRKAHDKNANRETRSEMNKQITKMINCGSRINHFIYRMFTSRLFFFSAASKQLLNDAKKNVLKQLQGNIANGNYEVIEIDISNYNVTCYDDTFMGADEERGDYYLFYANAFFPTSLMKFYTADEFDKMLAD